MAPTPCNIASLFSLYCVLHIVNDLRAHRGIVVRLNAVGVLENAMRRTLWSGIHMRLTASQWLVPRPGVQHRTRVRPSY